MQLETVMQKHVQYKHFLLSSFVGARAVAALVYGLYTMDIYAIVSINIFTKQLTNYSFRLYSFI